jgi:uncharacterized LabA/DUF88 family protein
MVIEHSRRVVLLIDYDNLQICASRDTPGRDLQLAPVVHLAQRYGTVILARAYAEWNLSTERLAVYKAGIEPAFAPVLRTESDRSGKSLADTVMVAEGMDMLWTLSPDVVVLATSDKDLIPLVRVAKQRGAFVVVLGSDFTAIPLREMADEHITYRQLITEASGRGATEAGPGRQPAALPEPSRRRPRERAGRERVPATATTQPAAASVRAERDQVATAAASEPVAPVTAGAASDSESPAGGRRRRRRGSRRRAERVGQAGEGGTAGEAAAGEAAEEGAVEPRSEVIEVAPEEAPAEAGTPVAEAPVESFDAEVAPAPRERRRRTRRTPAAKSAEAESESTPVEPAPAESQPELLPTPPPEPAAENGTAPSEETPARAPRAKPKRVASASRGRSRPASR